MTERLPTVSVVITTYNCADYVAEAVSSAIAQDYDSMEIVIVDDHSTDETFDVLQSMKDSRLRVHRNQARLGQIRNRNRAVGLARGELLKFLDGDDALEARAVARLAEPLRDDPRVGLAACRRTVVNPRGRVDTSEWAARFGSLWPACIATGEAVDAVPMLRAWLDGGATGNWIGEPTAAMVRRDLTTCAGGFPNVRVATDMALWAKIIARGQLFLVDEPLVRYRHGHESETSARWTESGRWLAGLEIWESLAADQAVRRCCPEVTSYVARARRDALRTAVTSLGEEHGHVAVSQYLCYLFARSRRRYRASIN